MTRVWCMLKADYTSKTYEICTPYFSGIMLMPKIVTIGHCFGNGGTLQI